MYQRTHHRPRSRQALVGHATLAVCLVAFAVPGSVVLSQEAALRGFLQDEVAAQREREEAFRAVPDPDRLREYMRVITEEPHHAGSPGSRQVALYMVEQLSSWGLEARIEEHEALMPMPVERVVELIAPTRFRLSLEEPRISQDKDSGDVGGLPSYNAYSADGDVTADLVYVNYGIPEDYERLEELGIDVAGKVVIAKYGRSWRGIKPKLAWEHGAVGCIIYSDPKEDGYYQGEVYPDGPFRPAFGVQRGSVMDMPVYPGDPLTPGWGSEPGVRKLNRVDATTILKIPVLPISYADAEPLLDALGGPVAPEDWRGALPITYRIGPGPARVHMKLSFDWQTRPLYNVVVRIDGTDFPDQWILHGNHHDAWVNGAADPTSGNVALMETARGLAELLQQGWRPKRTIILAAWDGEEWGLLGSTEWGEKHAVELRANAVAYINTDSTNRGWLSAGGSHSLQQFINEVARDVPGPRGGGSVREELLARRLETAEDDAARAAIESSEGFSIGALGSGSDYTVFLDHLTVASLNLGFSGDSSSSGVYHSKYDSFDWYTTFSDTDFAHIRALSQTVGTTILRLADATVLPFNFVDYATTIETYVEEIETLYQSLDEPPSLDLEPVRTALSRLGMAGSAYELALRRLDGVSSAALGARMEDVAKLNQLLFTSERALALRVGLPQRDWFKHLLYAPGLYTGYGVKTLPGIRESLEREEWSQATGFVTRVAEALETLADQVDDATALMHRVAG